MAVMLSVHPQSPQSRHIQRAVESLRDGGVVVYPTDTAYAIGCLIAGFSQVNGCLKLRDGAAKDECVFVHKEDPFLNVVWFSVLR